jgi:SET domain-containing protein
VEDDKPFFFDLADGSFIKRAKHGNVALWFNRSWVPTLEAQQGGAGVPLWRFVPFGKGMNIDCRC